MSDTPTPTPTNEVKSKSLQKREAKATEAAAKKAAKAESGRALVADFRAERLAEIQHIGYENAYPHKFPVDILIPVFRTLYNEKMYGEKGGFDATVTHFLGGRVMSQRHQGKDLVFIDLHADDAKVQVILRRDHWTKDKACIQGPSLAFDTFCSGVKRGDIIGVQGHPGRANSGELSIYALSGRLLSPCYHMLPKGTGLVDEETRKRQRYLDLLVNPDVRRSFYIRNLSIRHIRQFLDQHDFMEVETPILNVVAGGATARPFITHHNEYRMPMFLRIAPELYLKQLVIGGLDRVYEIGRVFRNEGVDRTHNPEFTICEFYWAYKDYNDLMDFTELMLENLVRKRNLDPKIISPEDPNYGTLNVDCRGHKLSFSRPWKRLPIIATIEAEIGTIPRPLDGNTAHAFLVETLANRKLDLKAPHSTKRIIDRLAEEYVEVQCIQPTFITDHPVLMTPLAKWNRADPELTERFELFVSGKELANAYTELNSPQVQRERFANQAKDRDAGDDETPPTDESFCTALEYGLPPTAGWGLGIDRLAMFLSETEKISEVIFFPTCKPDVGQTPTATATTNAK